MKSLPILSSVLLFGLMLMAFVSCGTTKSKIMIQPDITKTIPVVVTEMDVDNLGNIYVIDDNSKLIKYNAEGTLLYEFYNKRLGSIFSIDVSNPLEILLFFDNYGVVKTLDNTLSEIKSVDFNKAGKYVGAEVFCKSNDSFLWVVDPTTQKIVKVDDQLNIKSETNRFTDLGINDLKVLKMREAGNHLVVMTEKNGFLIFDNFAQFDKTIVANGATDFQFDGKGLLYETMTNFRYQKISFPDFSFVSLPSTVEKTKVLVAKKNGNNWIVAYPNGIDILKI